MFLGKPRPAANYMLMKASLDMLVNDAEFTKEKIMARFSKDSLKNMKLPQAEAQVPYVKTMLEAWLPVGAVATPSLTGGLHHCLLSNVGTL